MHDARFHKSNGYFANRISETFNGNTIRQRVDSRRRQVTDPRSPIFAGLLLHYNFNKAASGAERTHAGRNGRHQH